MKWLITHKRIWRTALLALLAISVFGPWGFDLIHVPAEFPCSAPHVRLSGDYCGLPLSLVWSLLAMVGDIRYLLATGLDLPHVNLLAIHLAIVGFPLLSLLSGIILILHEKGRRLHTVHLVLVGLALLGVSLNALLMGQAGRLHWALWGLWLYLSVAAGLWVLEIMTGRKEVSDGIVSPQ
jgi:hypothetical protein